MSRRVLVVAGVTAAAFGVAPARATPRPAAPARLLVQGSEFRLALSRPSVAAGAAIVQLANVGEDAHDLRLVRLDSRGRATGTVRQIPETLPGATGRWSGRLTRGRWRLSCSLPGHARQGMRATLRVR
ncbi:MAG: hypothetical protein QOH43_450 [Solirubrobacteraceae bacterium]|nr:hypothetical protein [Solirubrobacteraceae bacterium]